MGRTACTVPQCTGQETYVPQKFSDPPNIPMTWTQTTLKEITDERPGGTGEKARKFRGNVVVVRRGFEPGSSKNLYRMSRPARSCDVS